MPPALLPLFLAARLGDKDSLTELVICLVDRLRRFAILQLGNWYDADDVVQDTLLGVVRVCQNANRSYIFESESAFRGFVDRIMRNRIWRLRQRQGRSIREDDPFGEVLLNLFDPVEPNTDCEAVREVVITLTLTDQALFELYVEGYSSAEIAALRGARSDNTVRWRWARVCQLLRDALPELVVKYQRPE